ncbi:VWA domain-containing protein [Haladaptatus sp. QDMS2]|uniref:vWA domain-containing protein n=1 Tax=Haladaptatus sp. QDMS2 TaxID=3033391 RepID=UPI0023E84A92|nr:VWA domain-containing protein [Haladaptatus sp. QDMS2]
MRRIVLPLTVALLLVAAGCSGAGFDGGNGANAGGNAGSIGLAAGGANDATAFRNNVNEGYVPQPTDMTVEGLFHDYYFDTGQAEACGELFCPSYSRAVSEDPFSKQTERYLTVGLNSGLSKADFERKKLNLVVVLDTSGSMESPFSKYYYDGGEKQTVEDEQAKMAVARESVVALTEHLEADDRFGLVTYDDSAQVIHPLDRVDETDMDYLRDRIRGLNAGGGTNFDDGLQTATSMLEPHRDANQSEYETRIIFVTDAMPNLGDTSGEWLSGRLQDNANHNIYSTFVGVGVDFNTRFVETINEVPGANYYTVNTPDQFRDRMDEGFDYMVTPLVFNLSVSLDSDAYEIAQVYGSPTAEEATGEVMSVQTLFPSRREANRTEGGIILVKLRETGAGDSIRLKASFETRTGERHESTRAVEFGNHEAPYYDNSGVRKAVVLSRYANLMRNWAAYERVQAANGEADPPADGIEYREEFGEWEQQSVPLAVSPPYDQRIAAFEQYFQKEMTALSDSDMQQDAAILATLRTNATTRTATKSPTANATG